MGEYQLFENISQLPSSMLESLNDFKETNRECVATMKKMQETLKSYDYLAHQGSEKIKDISDTLKSAFKVDDNDPFSITSVIENVKKHPAGIIASLTSLMRCSDYVDFSTNLVSLASLLGFEQNVIVNIRKRWEQIEDSSHLNQYQSTGNVVKILCLLLSVLGKTAVGSSITNFAGLLRDAKKNSAVYKDLLEEVEDLAEEYGFGFSTRAKVVREMKNDLEILIKDIMDYEHFSIVSPIRFCRMSEYKRFKETGKKIETYIVEMSKRSMKDFIGTAMSAEIMALHQRYIRLQSIVESVRRTNGERVKPVGIAFYGMESQIGKSHLMTKVEFMVKNKLQAMFDANPEDETLQAFANAKQWATWEQNIRDKFDQNYDGHEGHTIDDCFSSKEDLEHQMLITFISNRAAATYQPEMTKKGFAYVSRYVLISCNKFPRDSKMINNPHALAERFPIFIHCKLNGKNPVPKEGTLDESFNWLDLHLSSGHNFYNRIRSNENCPECFCSQDHTTTSIEEIVDLIISKMIINQQRFDASQKAYNNFEVADGFVDAYSEDYSFCKGFASKNVDAKAFLNQPEVDYYNFETLPDDIQVAFRSSRTNDPEYFELIKDNPTMCSSVKRNTIQDLMNLADIRDLHDILLYYEKYNFKPLSRYENLLHNFLQNNNFLTGNDAHFLWFRGSLYFNDICNGEILANAETYEEYEMRTMYIFSLVKRMFCDPLFLIYGVVFVSLNLLGLPGVICLTIIINVMRAHGVIHGIVHKGNSYSTADFTMNLFMKGFTIFALWVLFKFVYFLCKKIKNFMIDPIWNLYTEEHSILVANYESSKVSFRRRDIYRLPNDNTCVLVTATGGHPARLSYLRQCPNGTFGKNCKCMVRNVNIIYMYCRNDDMSINKRAFSQCLDQISEQEIFLAERDIVEDLKPLLEQHGNYHKVVCFSYENSFNYEFSHPYSNHPGIKPQSKVKNWRERDTSDDEFEVEDSGKQERKRQNKSFKRYEGEGSGLQERKRQNKSFKQYEQEGSGDKQRKRQNKQFKRYEYSYEKGIPKLPKLAKHLETMHFTSSELDSFGEEDYNPSCVEEDQFEGIRLETIETPLISCDDAIIFPKDSKYDFANAEKQLEGTYESAIDANANAILRKIQDYMNVRVYNFNGKHTGCLFGIGVGKFIVFPSHLVNKEGDIVMFKQMKGTVESDFTYFAKVIKFKKEWELCSAEILPLNHAVYLNHKRLGQQNLIFGLDILKYVPLDHDVGSKSLTKYCLQHLPKQGFIIPGMVSYVADYKGKLSGEAVECEIYAMKTMPFMNAQTIPGDCGGCVVMLNPSCTRKLIGMHIGSGTNIFKSSGFTESHGIIAILSLSRLQVLTCGLYDERQNRYENDYIEYPKITWAKENRYDNFTEYLEEDGYGIHMPPNDNDAFIYIGDLIKKQPPCDINGKTDHIKTPFYGCFEETKIPSVLRDIDVVDDSKLLCDEFGNKSIIVSQLAGYGDVEHSIDQNILNDMTKQLTDYMIDVMTGFAIGTSTNSKTAMWESINGQYFNDDFDKINEKSSAGIPWSMLGLTSKSSVLEDKRVLNMYRTCDTDKFINGKWLKQDKTTNYFKRVFNNKMQQAMNLKRTFSIWKVCLKDELRKIEKVEVGATRAFIAPPLETFFMGRYLFGRWKSAFKACSKSLFHAVGINMKSNDVAALISEFKQHPNYMDIDYKNFDQRLLAQFIKAVAVVIVETIRHSEKNNDFANARYVYFEELIYTVLCANKTVFMTKHGNKSGNVLTTELNCLVNFLYGWYVFRKVTNMTSLIDYMKHVVDKNYGDDKGMAFSDHAKELGFNFMAYQQIMQELGQIVTPGNKSEVLLPCFNNICEMQFLKRNFIEFRPHIWLAPLDKTSIESVFNYSCLTEEEIEEWKNTIFEQLIEAALWGKSYYNNFVTKLRTFVSTAYFKRNYMSLRESIMPILLYRYKDIMTSYFIRIGILDSESGQNEKIIVTLENFGGRTKIKYQEVECSSTLDQNKNKENIYQSDIIIKNIDKFTDLLNTECISVMENVRNFIQQCGTRTYNLGLNAGNNMPEEVNPETDIQLEGVQSDVGKPIRVNCADGMVMAYPLGQSDRPASAYQIPRVMDVQYSLPNELKHFNLIDPITLGGLETVVVLSPTLAQIAPKAHHIHDIFQYSRVKMCLLRIDSRPPLGYSQLVKVVCTTTAATDTSAFNRKGVTYNLAKCPTMYFMIPYCDREFMKTIDEPWFKVFIQRVTSPIARTDIPDPFYFRPSFEVLDMDYYVHKNLDLTANPPISSDFSFEFGPITTTATGVTFSPLGVGEIPFSRLITTVAPILINEFNTGNLKILPAGSQISLSSTVRIAAQVSIDVFMSGLVGDWVINVRCTVGGTDVTLTAVTSQNLGVPSVGWVGINPITFASQQQFKAKSRRRPILGTDYEKPDWNKYEEIPLQIRHDIIDKQLPFDVRSADLLNTYYHTLPEPDFKIHLLPHDEFKRSVTEQIRRRRETNRYENDDVDMIDLSDDKIIDLIEQESIDVCTELIHINKQHDYISQLKLLADSKHLDVKYEFDLLPSSAHQPIYKCVVTYDNHQTNSFGVGKKLAKQHAAEAMLSMFSEGEYQMDMDLDVAAAEPSEPKNPMPPVAVAKPQSLAMGQTIGNIGAHIDVTENDFVPIETYEVTNDLPNDGQVFKFRIHPGNFTSAGVESQAQIAFRNHVFSGPGVVNGKISYCTFKITSAANAFQNARLLLSQIPLEYTAAQVDALKPQDLKQFPSREHKLHGTETIFNPQWVNRLPELGNHQTDPSNTNGWLVCKVLENSLVDDSVNPRLTLWVCANAVNYSMPRVPVALPVVVT